MNKTVIGVIIGVIVLGGGALLFLKRPEESAVKKMVASPTPVVSPSPAELLILDETSPTPGSTDVTEESGAKKNAGTSDTAVVKAFTVTGKNFSFDLTKMDVKKGDTVKITFKNAEGFHDFVIDEFKVKTKRLQGGQEETIEFVADQAGTFEYYCSVGEHRKMGMKGTLTVQ